jgi:uncharacterized Fe-S center protein
MKHSKELLTMALLLTLGLGTATIAHAATPGTPMNERSGGTSKVYFTRDLSSAGLIKIYKEINKNITGRVAIKLHTGEPHGPNILPREWVKDFQAQIPNSRIVETNTYYHGGRYTTAEHRATLKTNGWTFSPVDIMDEDGTVMLPVKNGLHFKEMSMGKNIMNYDSMIVLTHFKGHTMGGFGGSMKNIAIGCADGRIGKAMIHTGNSGSQWGISKEPFMENMADSAKATVDHFGKHIVFINVLRNMSVDCDCAGVSAAPPTISDIGILASTDILAVDQASIDKVWAADPRENHDLVERIESRKGLRQLSAMKELHMGNDKYELIDLDKK